MRIRGDGVGGEDSCFRDGFGESSLLGKGVLGSPKREFRRVGWELAWWKGDVHTWSETCMCG